MTIKKNNSNKNKDNKRKFDETNKDDSKNNKLNKKNKPNQDIDNNNSSDSSSNTDNDESNIDNNFNDFNDINNFTDINDTNNDKKLSIILFFEDDDNNLNDKCYDDDECKCESEKDDSKLNEEDTKLNKKNTKLDEEKTELDEDDAEFINYLNDRDKNKNKKQKPNIPPKKRDKKINDDTSNLDRFFMNIFNNMNDKNNLRQHKNDNVDENDFNHYFNEAKELLPIDKEIKTITDLIELGKTYDVNDKNRYVINLKALNKCVKPLEELDAMIGMKNIKQMIIDLIFFRLQNIDDNNDELWHLVIQGTPGSGKTEVAKILAKLYYSMGIVQKEELIMVKRSDLIGKYLGHTAKMTQDIFDNAKGSVLFIDEAYSLGHPEGRDSFSKECIDTINQNLTENRETVVFIAGYKDQLNESFFSYNPGLNRRFKMRLNVDKYSATDLRQIFLKKIKDNKWNIYNDNDSKELPVMFFEKNISLFKYNGGDMENLWHLTKIVHARRIFGKSNDLLKKITNEDLQNAFKLYCENDEVKTRETEDINKYLQNTMYC